MTMGLIDMNLDTIEFIQHLRLAIEKNHTRTEGSKIMTKSLWKRCEDTVYKFFNNLDHNCLCYRFVDSADINRQSYKTGAKFTVANLKAPADFVMIVDGEMAFAEVKCTDSKTGVTHSLLKQQVPSRHRVMLCGGHFAYFIYSVAKHHWYLIPAEFFEENGDNQSWKKLEDFAIELPNPEGK